MKTTTLQLLPTTTYSTPSGNYDGSSTDWNGVDQPAANYYGSFGGLQTMAYYLSGFQGLIKVQATLDAEPSADSDWFEVDRYNSTSSASTDNFSVNITGNFVWVRVKVENFSAGTITKLMMSY